ncbi:hypothetical protein Sste5346_002211 [Sporothrix stenoceras]|uniref:Gal80p-like C-terminal domain-containing protein n=1 Tax=Sporothrix stenoceras TaxID=5173 RepID=A0ABR3ZIG1_9PEZI
MVIKVALVGLSARAATSWASRAHLPYLLSDQGRKQYQIVALLNSSVDAAREAIKHYGLPSDTTAAYGDPDALATDIVGGQIEVNLVSTATRVDVHYPIVQPILKAVAAKRSSAPKDFGVFVEWPLGANLKEVAELTDLVKDGNIKSIVGLQGRVSPVYLAVRDLIASGRIGRVLSSDARANGGSVSRSALSESLGYFLDRSVGGNVITIGLGHTIDSIQAAIGELSGTQSQAQLQRPKIDLRKPGEKEGEWIVTKTVTSDVPDLITVLGKLTPKQGSGKEYFSDGTATFQIRFVRGEPFPGEPGYVLTVAGEKGELRLVSPGGPSIQAFGGGGNNEGPTSIKLSVHDYESGKVEEVPWQWQDWQSTLEPVPARNIGQLYEAYAAGREADYATFADAQARHEQIEGWLNEFEKRE